MANMNVLNSTRNKPVYDEKTGKFLGWKLFYLVNQGGLLSPIPHSRFFRQTLFRNSYRAMCRFKNKLLSKQNENNK